MTRTRSLSLGAASLAAVAAVTFGATQASAQPVITGGLVNVTVANVNVLNNVRLGVALQAAADICGVSVAVLATQLPAPVSCTATTGGLTQIIPA